MPMDKPPLPLPLVASMESEPSRRLDGPAKVSRDAQQIEPIQTVSPDPVLQDLVCTVDALWEWAEAATAVESVRRRDGQESAVYQRAVDALQRRSEALRALRPR